MRLWLAILERANSGIPISLIFTRQPGRVCGYYLSGRACRIRIPEGCPLRGHPGLNNLLEFMGMAINIWVQCLNPSNDNDCILALGDSTLAIGWIHKTASLEPEWGAHEAHLMVSRQIANLVVKYESASRSNRSQENSISWRIYCRTPEKFSAVLGLTRLPEMIHPTMY